MKIQASSAVAAIAVLASGCAHMSLKEQAVKQIRVQPMETGLCPGFEMKYAVLATLGDGHEEPTTGAGHGKVGWKNYDVRFAGGTADDDKLRLSSDPRETWKGPAPLKVTVIDHPDVVWEGAIPVRYDCGFGADFSGSAGSSGSSGSDGTDGTGAGDRGESGSNGGDGSYGDNGPRVEVWVTTAPGPNAQTFVQAAVESQGDRRLFAFHPGGGSLTIDASGGKGGNGGSGGDGGKGGKGEKGSTEKQGRGGNGAVGGCGGDGGDGGDVVLHVDAQARAYRDLIRVRNRGGAGGDGGLYGSGGQGSPKGRDGRTGCVGRAGRDGRIETVDERVEPLW